MVVKFSVPNPVEVVRYNPLFTHWPTEVVAKFKMPRLVEVTSTGEPFWVKVNALTFPEPVAFVKVRFVEETVSAASWPDPVAFVKVIPVEETAVANTFVELTFPASMSVPVADTRNWVLEFTWKSMKLPLKPTAGFMPMKVPVTFDPWIEFGPMWKSEVEVLDGGEPDMRRAWAPEFESVMSPVAVNVPVCRFPLPVAFVKVMPVEEASAVISEVVAFSLSAERVPVNVGEFVIEIEPVAELQRILPMPEIVLD